MYSEEMEKALARLRKAIKKVSDKGGLKLTLDVRDVREALADFLAAMEEVMKRDEAKAEEEFEEELLARANYDLCHRRLLGLAGEIRPLARKHPDSPCNLYKLRQVNEVLLAMKDELEACYGAPMDLADEDAALSYSDVSFLLRTYLDFSAAYARQRYRLNYDENGN